MSNKTFAQVLVLVLVLLVFFAIPTGAQAGGVCGTTYIVQWGDTLEKIAWYCGTTVSALYSANPGSTGYLYAGQSLIIPGSDYCNCPPTSYYGTYIVQYGDTFSGIARRFGVSMNELWNANPNVKNINYLYAGQLLYIPGSFWFTIDTTPTESPISLSYGAVPSGTPNGKIKLTNKAKSEVYVSLQGTTKDNFDVIKEYSVGGTMNVKVPAGWYNYVAWVGGENFDGQFNLGGGSNLSITFYRNKIVVK